MHIDNDDLYLDYLEQFEGETPLLEDEYYQMLEAEKEYLIEREE